MIKSGSIDQQQQQPQQQQASSSSLYNNNNRMEDNNNVDEEKAAGQAPIQQQQSQQEDFEQQQQQQQQQIIQPSQRQPQLEPPQPQLQPLPQPQPQYEQQQLQQAQQQIQQQLQQQAQPQQLLYHQQQRKQCFEMDLNNNEVSNSDDIDASSAREIPTLPPMALLGRKTRYHRDNYNHFNHYTNAGNDNQNNCDIRNSDDNCFTSYLSESVWPGLGLFGESYLLFGVGTLRPIWELIYPSCLVLQQQNGLDEDSVCSSHLVHSLTYSVVLGVIVGMLVIGYMANQIGRRRGSILTASLMTFGSLGLTFASIFFVNSPQFLFSSMSCLLFVFGIGVGGEYPLSASSASERAMGDNIQRRKQLKFHEQQQSPPYQFQRQKSDASRQRQQQQQQQQERQHHHQDESNVYYNMNLDQQTNIRQVQQNRGKSIQLVFTMQGMGIFFNSLTMTALLIIMGQGEIIINDNINKGMNNNNNNNEFDDQSTSLLNIWRITYAIGSIILCYVLISRLQFLTESQVWVEDKAKRDQQSSKRAKEALHQSNNSVTEIMKHYSTIGSGNNHNNNINNGNSHVLSPTSLSTPIPVIPTVSSVSSLSAPSVVVHASLPDSPVEMRATQHQEQQQHHQHIHRLPEHAEETEHHNMSSLTEGNSMRNDNYNHEGHPKLNPRRCAEECEYYHVFHLIKQVPSTDPQDDIKSTPISLLLRNYGLRLFGAALSWLLWDISFYGNKLFQSSFILALTGEETTLLEFALAATLNAFIALLGYFAAAILIDVPSIGRRNLQQFGFLITGSLFVTCGFTYSSLSSSWLIVFYLGSSFFGQCGPNATTFLIPAEIFPTEMRTFCHGICAAAGKLGALFASIMFNYMTLTSNTANEMDDNNNNNNFDGGQQQNHSSQQLDMFLLSGYASFAACAITFWTIPETVGLDLFELDRKWRMILDGKKGDYIGPANHPKFLSYYERIKLGLQH